MKDILLTEFKHNYWAAAAVFFCWLIFTNEDTASRNHFQLRIIPWISKENSLLINKGYSIVIATRIMKALRFTRYVKWIPYCPRYTFSTTFRFLLPFSLSLTAMTMWNYRDGSSHLSLCWFSYDKFFFS